MKPKASWHSSAYNPTYQKYLEIFYHQVLCWSKKHTLLQEINAGSF